MIIRFILLVFIGLIGKVQAQGNFNNSLQIEGLGNGYYYSINYERIFLKKTTARIGLMAVSRGFAIPLLAGKYFGNSSSHFELSGGVTYSYYNPMDSEDINEFESNLAGTLFIGYRYQPVPGSFIFKIGYTPFFEKNRIYHWGGLSFGYRF
jgi:hypothetical protein